MTGLKTSSRRRLYALVIALASAVPGRLENDLDNVLHSPSLPEAKILKHRQCWPTALYVHKEGDIDPIFVDRMGILGERVLHSVLVAVAQSHMSVVWLAAVKRPVSSADTTRPRVLSC